VLASPDPERDSGAATSVASPPRPVRSRAPGALSAEGDSATPRRKSVTRWSGSRRVRPVGAIKQWACRAQFVPAKVAKGTGVAAFWEWSW